MNMNFGANKTPIEVLNAVHLEKLFLETFIIVLIVNGTESHGKNLMTWEILIIAQIIMMLVLINMVLNVEHHHDFGKIKVGLML